MSIRVVINSGPELDEFFHNLRHRKYLPSIALFCVKQDCSHAIFYFVVTSISSEINSGSWIISGKAYELVDRQAIPPPTFEWTTVKITQYNADRYNGGRWSGVMTEIAPSPT